MSRRALDFYETPAWMVRGLLEHVPELGCLPANTTRPRGRVLDPCVGDGAITRELLAARSIELVTNDVDPARAADFHLDARDPRAWKEIEFVAGPIDWVVTNPPFEPLALVDILLHALAHARAGVVLLARRSFLEPTHHRGLVLSGMEPDRALITERHSFTGNGKSDSVTTEWLCWARPPLVLSGKPIVVLAGYKPRRSRAARETQEEVATCAEVR